MRIKRFSVLLILLLSAGIVQAGTGDELSDERQAYLANLLKQDCGSCHGLTLKGGLGSSILPQDLKERSDEALFITIKNGLPGLAMPPWGELLSDGDIHWLVQRLREGDVN
ncbi:c-type cytochrome [Amphritea balenae]|uniref:Cytochrome c n=1 Tax=Amphritea balenae TaxID=452629 RepID=A0A3P1SSQ4_9GAMM|nr:c-type cytochrome [Amphritea balenae]RRC99914.1 cytochrome c [Amphritea balenae]GGK75050.1 cytochrome c55X [Amphritea balenae]